MSHNSDQRDLAILQAISGIADPASMGMQVEDNYFVREAMENRREQGYQVPEEWQPGSFSEREKELWKHEKWLQEMEQARTNRPNTEYCGNESEEPMERPEMHFMDSKFYDVIWNTHVNFSPSRRSADDPWFLVIKIGKEQKWTILVGSRKDGKGTYQLTDNPDWWAKNELAEPMKVIKL